MRLLSLLLVFITLGCASAPEAPPARRRRVAGSTAAVSPDGSATSGGEQAPVASGGQVDPATGRLQIQRTDLIPALDAGFGHFLGTVRVSAVLESGRFVGFRIDGFRDAAGRYARVDLAPGDVVVRVNGSAIERPEQALAVWNALRVTSELCVEYLRNGQRREIRYAIVD